ncbi:MAG: ParA family partition ATPase [Pseudomonadota bacterium]
MAGPIIVFAQQKGGAGKTTLAIQCAVRWKAQGRSVALIDIDPQGSLAAWHAARRQRLGQDCGFDLAAISGWRVQSEAERLAGEADIVVVDTAPHAEMEARAALRVCQMAIIPLQPSPLDVWATRPTLAVAREEKAPTLLVFNRTPARGRLSQTMREKAAEDLNAPIAEATLGDRVAFAETIWRGGGVAESRRKSRANEEIAALTDEIDARVAAGERFFFGFRPLLNSVSPPAASVVACAIQSSRWMRPRNFR